jgi:uncharacterized protein DUF4440
LNPFARSQVVPRSSFAAITLVVLAGTLRPSADDRAELDRLDREYQEAVRVKDTLTMKRILAPDFVLVTGKGRSYTRADLLVEARDSAVRYERQEDSARTVRFWGNTAVVTALLWEKGVDHGRAFDRHLWFSDTYVRTPDGWRYVFGQSSLSLE